MDLWSFLAEVVKEFRVKGLGALHGLQGLGSLERAGDLNSFLRLWATGGR